MPIKQNLSLTSLLFDWLTTFLFNFSFAYLLTYLPADLTVDFLTDWFYSQADNLASGTTVVSWRCISSALHSRCTMNCLTSAVT